MFFISFWYKVSWSGDCYYCLLPLSCPALESISGPVCSVYCFINTYTWWFLHWNTHLMYAWNLYSCVSDPMITYNYYFKMTYHFEIHFIVLQQQYCICTHETVVGSLFCINLLFALLCSMDLIVFIIILQTISDGFVLSTHHFYSDPLVLSAHEISCIRLYRSDNLFFLHFRNWWFII